MASCLDIEVGAEVEFDEDDVAAKDSKKRDPDLWNKVQRRLIRNLKSFIDDNLDNFTAFNTNNVPKLIGKMLGVSKTTVQRSLNDNPEAYQYKYTPVPKPLGKRYTKVSSFIVANLTEGVPQCYREGIQPTSRDILRKLQDMNINQTQISLTTMQRVLNNHGFTYRKTTVNRDLLEGKEHIQSWRVKFLLEKRRLTNEGWKFYFQDESSFDSNDVMTRGYQHKNMMETQVTVPFSGKGNRIMICGIGSEDGFVPNASLVFHAKTPVEGLPDDYHKSMNAEVFENWIFNLVETGKIPSHSVIIMDNAPYHSRKEFLLPNKSWKKKDIVDFIFDKSQESLIRKTLEKMTKVQLLSHVNSMNLYPQYFVDKELRKHGVLILRLPPYHCRWNPIEMAWSLIKENTKKRLGRNQELNFVKSVLEDEINHCNSQWNGWTRKTKQIEEEEALRMELDQYFTNVISE